MAYLIRFINNVTAIVTVAVVLNFLIKVRFGVAVFSLLLLTFPLKYSEHYKYNVAMSYSVRDMSKRKRCLLSLSFGYVLSRYAAMCIAYLLHPYGLSFFFRIFWFFIRGNVRSVSCIRAVPRKRRRRAARRKPSYIRLEGGNRFIYGQIFKSCLL